MEDKNFFFNYTQKQDKCLTCAAYQYACQGILKGEREIGLCDHYALDDNAFERQDRDDTYCPPEETIPEEDSELEKIRQGKQKCYVFYDADDKDDMICECYVNDVPLVNEELIIWQEEKFTTYIITKRILGINAETGNGVWNLYCHKK